MREQITTSKYHRNYQIPTRSLPPSKERVERIARFRSRSARVLRLSPLLSRSRSQSRYLGLRIGKPVVRPYKKGSHRQPAGQTSEDVTTNKKKDTALRDHMSFFFPTNSVFGASLTWVRGISFWATRKKRSASVLFRESWDKKSSGWWCLVRHRRMTHSTTKRRWAKIPTPPSPHPYSPCRGGNHHLFLIDHIYRSLIFDRARVL